MFLFQLFCFELRRASYYCIRSSHARVERVSSASRARASVNLWVDGTVPDLSITLVPLNCLLKRETMWVQSTKGVAAFDKVKQLMSDTMLTHFNPRLPLVFMPDGGEQPVAYASRTLSPVECNYAQIDKEALAVVWGVKKFHQYLYGLNFTRITDHQPLTALFSPDRSISATAALRLQRQALFLSAYTYTIKYRNTTQHTNADQTTQQTTGKR